MTLPPRPRAVITGAASGFGRAMALTLASRGGRLVISDIDEPGLATTAERARTVGAEVVTLRADVRDPEAFEAMAEEIEQAFGGTDLLVNNAGVASTGPVGDVPLEDWRWQIDINLWGVIYGCHVFAPRMRAAGSGFILNVASAAGLVCAPRMGPYNVTKAGVIALSETMVGELADAGVVVSVLCPTFFRTNIHHSSRSSDPSLIDQTANLVENSKWSAEQIADYALAAMERGDLYIIPQADGRVLWRAKRLLGPAFVRVAARIVNNDRMLKWLSRR